jgi:ferredoxin
MVIIELNFFFLIAFVNGYFRHPYGRKAAINRLAALKYDPSYFIKANISKPLGISLEEIKENAPCGVFISSIGEGNAKASGLLTRGLHLIEVEGKDVRNSDFDSVIDIISGASSENQLKFVFIDPKYIFKGSATLSVITPEGTRELKALKGQVLRNVLLDSGVKVYDDKSKFTNCGGGLQCRKCVVRVSGGDTEAWEPRPDVERLGLKSYDEVISLQLILSINKCQHHFLARTLILQHHH